MGHVAFALYPARIRGDSLGRFRLSTLMLLIVFAALGFAMVVHYRQAARRAVELQRRQMKKCDGGGV